MRGLVGGLEQQSQNKAIYVYPDALHNGAWDLSAGSPDIDFFDALIAQTAQDYCLDLGRVFAVGFSDGAYFVNRLAIDRPTALLGVASASGSPRIDSATSPVAIWISHGHADTWVPFADGEHTRDYWVAANSCAQTTLPFLGSADCSVYQGCGAGKPVVCAPLPATISGRLLRIHRCGLFSRD